MSLSLPLYGWKLDSFITAENQVNWCSTDTNGNIKPSLRPHCLFSAAPIASSLSLSLSPTHSLTPLFSCSCLLCSLLGEAGSNFHIESQPGSGDLDLTPRQSPAQKMKMYSCVLGPACCTDVSSFCLLNLYVGCCWQVCPTTNLWENIEIWSMWVLCDLLEMEYINSEKKIIKWVGSCESKWNWAILMSSRFSPGWFMFGQFLTPPPAPTTQTSTFLCKLICFLF